jgi:hypothetical protein
MSDWNYNLCGYDGYSFSRLCASIWSNEFMRYLCASYILCYNLYFYINSISINKTSNVNNNKSIYRIGSHNNNNNLLSIIFGSLLGYSYIEKELLQTDDENLYDKRKFLDTNTKITFFHEGSHIKYILILYEQLFNLDKYNWNKPIINTKLSKGKIKKTAKFSTYTDINFN